MIKIIQRLIIICVVAFVVFCALQRLLVPAQGYDFTQSSTLAPTKAATVGEILEMNLPSPVRSKVSLPGFSYKQAFPSAIDKPEIVIKHFSQAPQLADRTKLAKDNSEWLPPVEQRLPINPAVVSGPDGIGNYGGIWHQTTDSAGHLSTKIGYESFIRFDPSGNIQPNIAYKWDVSPDNRVFTFYLRKGHKWSDGQPFTAQAIAFVCNELIGSATWSTPPNWMQPTDGSSLLYVDDVLDWQGLAKEVLKDSKSDKPSASKQLMLVLPEQAIALLKSAAEGKKKLHSGQKRKLVSAFNKALQNATFYNKDAFAGIDLESEIQALLKKGVINLDKNEIQRLHLLLTRKDWVKNVDSLSSIQRSRMNLLLLRAALPKYIKKAEKTRVKVEAVADKDGDNSHIIRFTFHKPNSIFLEKTATFMFYRGIFTYAPHYHGKYHVKGLDRLAEEDVINFDEFLTSLQQKPQIWKQLDKELKSKVSSYQSGDNAAKGQIIAGINRVLAGQEFLTDSDWSEFAAGLPVKVKKLVEKGCRKFGYPEWRRYDELNKQQELLQKVADKGADTLSKKQLLRLNVALFRGLFSPEVVAINREAGLNNAAQNGPRRFTNWKARSTAMGNYNSEYSPNVPTLLAWRGISDGLEKVKKFVRNPYYYKVDAVGNQLPYIDEVDIEEEGNKEVRLLKMRSGNVDFQTRGLHFDDFTVLKQGEEQGDYDIRLWPNDYCGEVVVAFLQTHKNPKLRKLFTNPRFRKAMSMAIDRQQIIDVVYKGIGKPAGFAVPEGSKYFVPKMLNAFTKFDPKETNRILDEIGLDKRTSDGMRCFADGTPVLIDINTTGTVPYEVVQMICNYWQNVGVNAQVKERQGGLLNRMISMGTADAFMQWEGGNYFGPLLAGSLAPTHPAESLQWSSWVDYLHSGGRKGEEPPEWFDEIIATWNQLVEAPNEKIKLAAWQKLGKIFVRDLPTIGVMTSPGQIVYVKRGFMNVPQKALSGWIAHQPGNCCPESFFFSKELLEKSSKPQE